MAVERFFQKLSGRGEFYDFDDQLNYFDYFGIEPEDIIKMFDALEKNSTRMSSYMNELEQMIFERFEFYSSNIRDAKAGFIKIFDEKTIQSGKAYVASMIYLGARLIAQEYVLLSTANKANFSVDLRVYKFGQEKYNYRLYLKSLKTFYESLSAWSYVFIKNNEEMLTFFSKMDDYIDRKIYDLKAYKDIFMLIWLYAYVKQAKDIRDYHLSLDPQTAQHVTIRKNVLNPLYFEKLFTLEDEKEEKKRRARIDDYKLWVDPDLKQNIKDTKSDLLDLVPYNKVINLRDYFNTLDKLIFSFEYYNFYDYQGYMTNLYETVQKALGEKVSSDLLEEIIKNSLFHNISFQTTDVLNDFYDIGIYKRPLIGFNDSQRRFFVMGYPEIIWMAIKAQEEYMLFDSPIRNKMYELVDDKMHDMLNNSLQKLAKRFAVVDIYQPESVPYFANRSRDKKSNLIVDAIAYEKNAENCFFFFNNFFEDSPLMWDTYRNSLKTSVGPGNLLDRVVKNQFSSFSKDLKKIRKQMGLPKDAQSTVVLIVNDVLEVNPKMQFEEYDLFVVDFSTIEFFLTSFIYKK